MRLNGRGASIGASGGSTAEFSLLTDHAKNGGYIGADPFHAKFRRKEMDPLPNAPIRPIRAHIVEYSGTIKPRISRTDIV